MWRSRAHMMRGWSLGTTDVADQQFLVQLLARAQADVLDLDVAVEDAPACAR